MTTIISPKRTRKTKLHQPYTWDNISWRTKLETNPSYRTKEKTQYDVIQYKAYSASQQLDRRILTTSKADYKRPNIRPCNHKNKDNAGIILVIPIWKLTSLFEQNQTKPNQKNAVLSRYTKTIWRRTRSLRPSNIHLNCIKHVAKLFAVSDTSTSITRALNMQN